MNDLFCGLKQREILYCLIIMSTAMFVRGYRYGEWWINKTTCNEDFPVLFSDLYKD